MDSNRHFIILMKGKDDQLGFILFVNALKLDKAKQELRSKDDAMRKLEEGFQNVEGKAKVKDQLFKNQQEKVNELESQLASKTELCRQLEKQLLQLSEGKKEKEEICSDFQQKVSC